MKRRRPRPGYSSVPDQPQESQEYPIDSSGTLEVRLPSGDETVYAAIYDSGGFVSSHQFDPDTANPRPYRMPVGALYPYYYLHPLFGMNKLYSYSDDHGSQGSFSFGVYSASGVTTPPHRRCKNCRPGAPVPVSVKLQLDAGAKVDPRAVKLFRKALLIHSRERSFACCWFSPPRRFGAGANMAFWILQKRDALTWTLTRRRVTGDVVAYSCKLTKKGDCSFPITLKLTSQTEKDIKKWPARVTITPAE
jgi:hypothetical protein